MTQGDIGDYMVLLLRGSVVVKDEEKTVAHMDAPTIFGEIAVFSESVRMATVQATSFCDARVLMKFKFDELVLNYPELRDVVRDVVLGRCEEIQGRKGVQTLEGIPHSSE